MHLGRPEVRLLQDLPQVGGVDTATIDGDVQGVAEDDDSAYTGKPLQEGASPARVVQAHEEDRVCQSRLQHFRALQAHEPALVLADEPTGNLDAHTGEQVLELLAELFRDQGRTLILVTHSLAVSRIAHRVLSIEEGRLSDAPGRLSW